jgi:N-acetylmuramoyl-L-alanine amidase
MILALVAGLMAADFTGVKIYVNPGHGGWDSNDRNIQTIPFAMGDTLGFWESKSNLIKGLYLRDLLQSQGATVYMSRTLNRTQDDRSLSEIAAEANANNVDAFLSIHSNAVGANVGTNYLLLLFHGRDNAPKYPQSLVQAQKAWPRLINNQLTTWTHYTTSTNIRGDSTFYGTYGLGVLTPLVVPGFLSEGSFHDYKPETHRLLNADYCKLEATNFHRYFCDYFQADLPTTGMIAGFVKGVNQTINHPQYIYKAGTHDRWLPLNKARVKLMNAAGDSLNGYQVDTLYNGVFAFHQLQPGTYKLRITAENHTAKDTTVSVTAAATTYAKMMLVNPSLVVERDTTPNYPDPVQEAGAIALSDYNFTRIASQVPDWLNTAEIRRAIFRNDKWYVLTSEPKILVINAVTNVLIKEMDLTGISGGLLAISDIAFTSDGYLLACNKDVVSLPETQGRYFKVYTWNDDNSVPALLFQTQSQGNWVNGEMGETMAVSGPRWRFMLYTPSLTTGTSRQIRIVGLNYEEGQQTVGYKYMLNTTAYTEALWGKKLKFTVSPFANDRFVVDSELFQPTDFQFDWAKPDRDPLIAHGTFTASPSAVSFGNTFFRHAGAVMMAVPQSEADSSAVTLRLYNVSNGLGQAVAVSESYTTESAATGKVAFMAAGAKVSGYDIEMLMLAGQQGVARFKTVAPAVKANIFASELSLETLQDGYRVKFTLNEASETTRLHVQKNGDASVTKAYELGALPKGVNSKDFTMAELDLEEGSFSWSIETVTSGIDRPMKFSSDALARMQFYSPRGVAVDNSMESKHFGRVYASETIGGTVTARATTDGIYILNSALEDVTAQGATAYGGGVAWVGASSPMRVSVGEDGLVYLTDWSDANPGVWRMNPEQPSAPFTRIFSGLSVTTGLASLNGVNVHGAISHCWVTGTGENTKLFTFDKYYVDAVATNRGNLLQYNIGAMTAPRQTPPDAIVYNDGLNGNLQQNYNSCIAPDGRGGWWISQHRAEDAATIPSLINVDATGAVKFNSGLTPLLIGNSVMAGMAVHPDGKRLAMGCLNEVKVFEVTFNASGVPTLKLMHSIKPAMGTNTVGLDYDLAGNLYVISNSSERLGVWAMPKAVNSFVTNAPSYYTITVMYTSVQQPSLNPDELVRVYPNPVRDELRIETPDLVVDKIELFDMNGRVILTENGTSGTTVLQVGSLQVGTYLVRVYTEQGIVTKRILKK